MPDISRIKACRVKSGSKQIYKQIVSQQFEAVVLAIDIAKRFSSELLQEMSRMEDLRFPEVSTIFQIITLPQLKSQKDASSLITR